jgi:hypothetical protein
MEVIVAKKFVDEARQVTAAFHIAAAIAASAKRGFLCVVREIIKHF